MERLTLIASMLCSGLKVVRFDVERIFSQDFI